MSDHTAREIAVTLRRAVQRRIRGATRGALDDGGRLILGGGGKAGVLPPAYGGTGGDLGAEPPLGDPPAIGYLLSATPDGTRRWVPLIAGSGISISVNAATGAITIGNATTLDTLTFGGDDLTFGGAFLGYGEA